MGFSHFHLLAFGAFAYVMVKKVMKLSTDLENCWTQVADEDHYSGQQAQRIDALFEGCRR